MRAILVAVTIAAMLGGAPGAAPPGTLAFDARALRARRTVTGFTLDGRALVSDACHAARFERSARVVFPALFDVMQYRPRSRMGAMCVQRLMWVTIAPLAVGIRFQTTVNVLTKNGTQHVPIP